MPKTMKAKFPSVHVIVDCTEVYAEVPQSLIMHKLLYSGYKSHVTIKIVVGIVPGGGFTFISAAFPGSYSDRGIVLQSEIRNPSLWEKGDLLMADRGFPVQDLFEPLGVQIIMPDFLKGKGQFRREETVMNHQTASKCSHVERMIEKLKNFHIFDSPIHVTIFGSVSHIITICALLCNMQDPIIASGDNMEASREGGGVSNQESHNMSLKLHSFTDR